VDWLVSELAVQPEVGEIRSSLAHWPGGKEAAERKLRLFEDRIVQIALDALRKAELIQ